MRRFRKVVTLALIMIALAMQAQVKDASNTAAASIVVPDTIGTADYLSALQRASESLEAVRAQADPSLSTITAIAGIKQAEQDLLLISINLSGSTSGNARNLKMYRNVLTDMRSGLSQQDSLLRTERKRLTGLKENMATILADSVIDKIRQDKRLQQEFAGQITLLRGQWKSSDSLIQHYQKQVNDFLTTSVQNKIVLDKTNAEITARMEKNSLGQEYSPIWSASGTSSISAGSAKGRLISESMAFVYYLRHKFGNMAFIILVLLGGGWWLRRAKKPASGEPLQPGLPRKHYADNLLAAGAVLTTTLLIYTNLEAPASVAALLFILQAVTVGIIVYRNWDRPSFRIWLGLISIFIFSLLLDLFVDISMLQRLLFFAVNGLAIWYRKKLSDSITAYTTGQFAFRAARFLLLWLNATALLCNAFGSVTLAQSLTLAGFIFVAQWVALSVCQRIIIESLNLQVTAFRKKKGRGHSIDCGRRGSRCGSILLLRSKEIWRAFCYAHQDGTPPLPGSESGKGRYGIILTLLPYGIADNRRARTRDGKGIYR